MKKLWIAILIIFVSLGCGKSEKDKGRTIYKVDFENGSVNNWTGGETQKVITYKNSGYALKGISGENAPYIVLEIWKKFPVKDSARLDFAYYCENVNDLIINCWSNKRSRNYTQVIRNPNEGKWTPVSLLLKDFGEGIGSTINSIHIAAPNKHGAVLIVDDVELYNE